MLSSRI